MGGIPYTILLVILIFASFDAKAAHPLEQLSPSEITSAVNTIKAFTPGITWWYNWVTLKEPLKTDLLPYFLNDIPIPEDHSIPRKALCILTHSINASVFEVVVNVGEGVIESWTPAPRNVKAMAAAGINVNPSSEEVAERLVKLGVTDFSLVYTDPWYFGYDGDRPDVQDKLVAQVYLNVRKFEHDNPYAHPTGFVTIVDVLKSEVLGIEDIPIHDNELSGCNREGDKLPITSYNYDPSVLPPDFPRKDVKPVQISQPDGTSFKLTGNQLEWQKFKMIIGFDGRIGVILHQISYNDGGKVRPLIYRAALSELFIPYGDPRPPFHRLMGFDGGQAGIGQNANILQAQIDCKGSVQFLDVIVQDINGQPIIIPQAICIFEEDAGILWKKKDPLTGRSVTTRSQRLVISFTTTVGNYDYVFSWQFYQDASIKMDIKLTGIIHPNFVTNETPLDSNSFGQRHNTRVADNVNAPYHQHIFAFRIDPEFDGSRNSVSMVDIHPDHAPTGSPRNPYGNGFTTTRTVFKTAGESRTKVNAQTGRTWLIHAHAGTETKNKSSSIHGGYKLIPENGAGLMIKTDSPLHPKGAFADYNVWVTPYAEDQLYAGGLFLDNGGLPKWIAQNPYKDIENEDIVLWHVWAVTHIPRKEDFPVMPSETTGFTLKPTNFFKVNPALDVPSFVQENAKNTKITQFD